MTAPPIEPCLYCEEVHDNHRVTIHLDAWENTEYRPIETVIMKGGLL